MLGGPTGRPCHRRSRDCHRHDAIIMATVSGGGQCRPTIWNISTPPTKNEGSGKQPWIKPLKIVPCERSAVFEPESRRPLGARASGPQREAAEHRPDAGAPVTRSVLRSPDQFRRLPSATTPNWRPRYRTPSPEPSIRRCRRRAGETGTWTTSTCSATDPATAPHSHRFVNRSTNALRSSERAFTTLNI